MKKIIAGVLAAVMVLNFTGCIGNSKAAAGNKKKVINIGATPSPHAEILEVVKPLLEKEGYELKVKVFSDYKLPNRAVESGELDANYFQHVPYLEEFNKTEGTHLVWTVKVHVEPMGIYSKKYKKVTDIGDKAVVTVPNDPTNGSRALKLLASTGVIKLNDKELVSKLDIIENKKNIKIVEMDAPQLPRSMEDADLSIINTNYAFQGGLTPVKDALITEPKDSPYANVIAVKKGNENTEWAKALNKVMTSQEVKKFIEDKYKGAIIPSF